MAYIPRVFVAGAPYDYFGGQQGIVVTLKTTGVPENLKALKSWNRSMERAAEKGVKKAVEYLLKQTLEVTPKDKGILRKSGNTSVIKAGKETAGIVYFDDNMAPYAIYVHEDLTKYHKPPTMAKFLQRTQWKERGKISEIIREEVVKARP